MKLSKLALLAAICCGTSASAGQGQHASYVDYGHGSGVRQVSHCDCGEAVCGCEAATPDCGCEAESCDAGCDMSDCDTGGCDGMPSCEVGCDSGCDSACDCGGGCALGSCPMGNCLSGDCGLGDPFTLFNQEVAGISAGGWVQTGYHSNNNSLFNNRADEFNLHQAWVYAERAIDTSEGFDIGGRIDYIYGIDANDTQAFGTDPRGWDNSWDNGLGDAYGHALPQVYMEAGYGDMSVKVGHFYTIIGWEVVTAPDNFFYSHAYTMFNSEPFTHTGALISYNLSEDVTAYGGYTFGWDSGFDDNGDSFLGGISAGLTDDISVTYATVAGRFGEARFNGVEKGYMHSIVADVAVTDNLQYIFQSDFLDTQDAADQLVRNTFGINQYLIYTYSDCLAFGGRFEWYDQEGVYLNDNGTPNNDADDFAQQSDIYALTLGVNYKPHANVVVRPEVRFDWDDDMLTGLDEGDQQTTFGIDSIFLF